MTWAEAFPNFLIGLREGLEAGLVVSILLAALRKTAPEGDERPSSLPVWIGVLSAVMLAGSFAAILTFSVDVLSSRAQQAVGGLLSVLAVGLVTAMVFWMRRTAATLSSQLRGEVSRAAVIGTGALAFTAFVAVSREGLETTLFLWTAVQASGSTLAPLVGAAVGLSSAVLLCWLLFRQAVRINLGKFFNRTALLLIVIAAGVLSYGLGDLQEAGLLSGQRWVAFDLTRSIDPNSWWASIVAGTSELTPRMTVLQVVSWLVYLVVVVPLFLTAGRRAPVPEPVSEPVSEPVTHEADRWERFLSRRPWTVVGAVVSVPALVAGIVITALPSASATGGAAIAITRTGCANGWSSARPGTQTFHVHNDSAAAGEIRLVDAAGGIVAEIETIGPATTADLTATLGTGSYTFDCLMSGSAATASPTVQVSGGPRPSVAAVAPATLAELKPPNLGYQAYAGRVPGDLAQRIDAVRADLRDDDLTAARRDWLAAQLDWERVGASYDSFGDIGVAVDGLPDGLPGGVADQHFTGLHRLEYGLWHGQDATELDPIASRLADDVATVRKHLTSDAIAGDPTNLPLRTHEILEDALRDHLSGLDDQGANAGYAMTYADTQVTRTLIGELAGPLDVRNPTLVHRADAQLATLQRALLATRSLGRWAPLDHVGPAGRYAVNGAIGALLQTLSAVPDLLEVPPA